LVTQGERVPRVGLNTTEVVVAGAVMADEVGIGAVTLASLAERLGVRPPALYKHVESLADLQHRIATLAMTELGEALRDALQGRSGADALAALFGAMRSYVAAHPGRYSATVGAPFHGEEDPLFVAGLRVITSIGAVIGGYGIARAETDHAIRALRCLVHGFAMLQAANAFQWSNDPGESVTWMIRFVDAGLRGVAA
jgi:AcrR family transcriptional regulator